MSDAIVLRLTHPTLPPGRVEGFSLIWAFYVKGFIPEKHCQFCFKGLRAPNFHSRNAASGVDIVLDRLDVSPVVYICGVAKGPEDQRRYRNLHLPVRYQPGATASATTYNGHTVQVRDAVALDIPPVADGWNGLPLRAHALQELPVWNGLLRSHMTESGEGLRRVFGRGEAIDDPRNDVARPAAGDAPTTFANGNNRFAFALYEHLRQQPGNLAFSPFSIRTALSMVLAGARGETAAQMARALCVPEGDGMRHADVAALVQQLQARGSDVALTVANSLWAQDGAVLQPAFLDIVAQHYEGAMQRVDFRRAPDAASAAINRWVEDATQGKITGLLQPGATNALTRLLLVNAVYFKASWASEFGPWATREQPFQLGTGGTAPVQLMRQRTKAGYLRADGFEVLDLPYAGGTLSLLVVLPDEATGLRSLEASLSAAVLGDVVTKLQQQPVDVELPRFTTTTDAVDLRDALSALGMPLPFDAARADFSGIHGHAPGHEEALHLSAAVHKVCVEVHERGTEAVAVTYILGPGGRPLGAPKPPPVPVFRADRPFLYAIRDRQSGALLFLGRMVDPPHNGNTVQVRDPFALQRPTYPDIWQRRTPTKRPD